jgi:hypothetical protein
MGILPRLRSFGDMAAYQAAGEGRRSLRARQHRVEEALRKRARGQEFEVTGYCCVCRKDSRFVVGFEYGVPDGAGGIMPNWREWQVCHGCGLNSRLRAAVDMVQTVLVPGVGARIYAQEQVTPFFRWLSGAFPASTGSEYLGPDHVGGQVYDNIRHEDATRLSFDDESFDHVVSFEVLEHIPDYERVLQELFRVMRPGGYLLLTAPFGADRPETLVRARVRPDGSINHLEPPEYHGNPVDPAAGSLCFYHFGWDVLPAMRRAGAVEVSVMEYSAPGRGRAPVGGVADG